MINQLEECLKCGGAYPVNDSNAVKPYDFCSAACEHAHTARFEDDEEFDDEDFDDEEFWDDEDEEEWEEDEDDLDDLVDDAIDDLDEDEWQRRHL